MKSISSVLTLRILKAGKEIEACQSVLCLMGQSKKEVTPKWKFKACVAAGRASSSDGLNLEQQYKGIFIDCYTKFFFYFGKEFFHTKVPHLN